MCVLTHVKTIGIGALSARSHLGRLILSDELVVISCAMFRNRNILKGIQ